jgi:hypothetical protein
VCVRDAALTERHAHTHTHTLPYAAALRKVTFYNFIQWF